MINQQPRVSLCVTRFTYASVQELANTHHLQDMEMYQKYITPIMDWTVTWLCFKGDHFFVYLPFVNASQYLHIDVTVTQDSMAVHVSMYQPCDNGDIF